ncbi:MAG: AsmA family protein [Candidatus Latescibacteria bacterium]|nr:AsmA family protein [bacterium]MBD3425519.1 AsmA family protein [Candidatus Latescibacterota bacterium]
MSGKSFKRKLHSVAKYSIITAGSLILLVAISLFLASLPPGEDILRKIAESQLSSALYQQVDIEDLQTNVISRMSLKRVDIPGGGPAGGGIHIETVELRYDLLSLINRTVAIESVNIRSPRFEVIRSSAEGFNIELLDSLAAPRPENVQKPDGEEGKWRIRIGTVRVKGAEISYKDLPLRLTARLDRLSLQAEAGDAGPEDISITLKSDSGIISYKDLSPVPVTLFSRGAWKEGRILSDSTRLVLGDLAIMASGSASSSYEYPPELNLKIRGRPPAAVSPMVRQLDSQFSGISGSVSIAAELEGPVTSPRGKLRGMIPALGYGGMEFEDIRLVFSRNSDTLALDTLEAGVAGGSISAEADLILAGDLSGGASLYLRSIRLDSIQRLQLLPGSPYHGTVDGTVRAEFGGESWSQWGGAAEINASEISYMSQSLGNTDLVIKFNRKRLSFDLKQSDAVAKGTVLLSDSALKGRISADIGRLEILSPFLHPGEISGAATLRADIGGSYASPSVSAAIAAKRVKIREIGIDTMRCGVRFDYDRVLLDSLCIYSDTLLIKAAGSFNRSSSAGNLHAGFFSAGAERNDCGSAAIPEEILNWRYPPKTSAMQGFMHAEFSLPGSGSSYLNCSGEGLRPGTFIPAIIDSPRIGGVLSFEVSARGPADSLRADLKLKLDRPRYNNIEIDSLILEGNFDRGELRVGSLHLSRSGQSVRGSIYIKLQEDTSGYWKLADRSMTRGELYTEQLDLGTFNPLLPGEKEAGGLVWMGLRWDGPLHDPSPAGSLMVRSGFFKAGGKEPPAASNIDIALRFSDSLATLVKAVAEINGIPVFMEGDASLLPEDRFRINLEGGIDTSLSVRAEGVLASDRLEFDTEVDSLDLRIFEPMIAGIHEIEGDLSADLHLGGSPKEPEVSGGIKVKGLQGRQSLMDRPVTGGIILADFDGKRIRVDTLFARLGGGTIYGSGSAEVDTSGITDISLELAGRRLQFVYDRDLEVHIDSLDLYWKPDGDYYMLGGRIDPGKIRYTRDIQPASLIPLTRDVRKVETELPRLMARTRLDINFSGADSVWIDNNLVHLRTSPDLRISGFLTRPDITGRMRVEEGYIIYLDRKFKVEEGVVLFSDPEKINPDITFRAVANVTTYQRTEKTEYLIVLKITGKADDPTVELSSNPPLPRPDIVSVLTLGVTRTQLSGQTGEVLRQRGEMLASQQISSYAGQKIGQTLGLDRVSVTGNIFDPKGAERPELIVGKELSEEVSITYRTSVGHLNEQRVKLNWKLSRRWMMEGTTTRSGESSLSLTYSLRFR